MPGCVHLPPPPPPVPPPPHPLFLLMNSSRPAPFKSFVLIGRLQPAAAFFLGLGALFCCSFFCPLDQSCKTLIVSQMISSDQQSVLACAIIFMHAVMY